MKRADVLLTWKKSVSLDIVQQYIRVYINEEYFDTTLAASVESYQVGNLTEKDRIHVELWAWDGTFQSEKATLDFDVPDLSVPAAPTKLEWTINKVVDDGTPEY